MPYYHVYIESNDPRAQCFELDKTELSELKEDVILPYLKGDQFHCDGYLLRRTKVEHILIMKSDISYEEYDKLRRQRSRYVLKSDIIASPEYFNNITGGRLRAKVTKNRFTGQNRYYQLMLGSAYKFNDTFSMSGGLKYVYAHRKLDGEAQYSYNPLVGAAIGLNKNYLSMNSKRNAEGIGGIIGFDYKPTDTLNIEVKYDTPVKMKFKAKTTEVKGMSIAGRPLGISMFYPEYADGAQYRRDLPGVLSLGVSKDIDKFTYSAGYTRYFNKAAKMDRFKYKDGYEINFGIDYRINDKFTWHAGFNYADTGAPRNTFTDVEYAVNSQIYATGLTYKPTENSEWKFGIAHVSYNSANGEKENTALPRVSLDKSKVKYDKSINVFTVGYTHKF